MTTATSPARNRDGLGLAQQRAAQLLDGSGLAGHGTYVLRGPDGAVKQTGTVVGEFENLITDVGDEFYAKRGAGAAVNAVTGMRLGTGTTAVAKNGAGAAIVTYVAGSSRALDAGFPTAATKGAGLGWRVQYKTTWPAGAATATGIAEAVITNEAPGLTDVAGTAANSLSRALLSPTVNKGSNDTLELTWNHDLQGQP